MERLDQSNKERITWKGHFRCCQWVVAYTFLVIFIIFAFIRINSPVYGGWTSRAKGTLRSLGSTQLAYQSTNEKKVYGSYEAMIDTHYVQEGYTLGNQIENYSLTWEVVNISTVPTEDLPSGIISSFTIVAWPRGGDLGTFAIMKDQIVRQCGRRDDPDNVATWDPIF